MSAQGVRIINRRRKAKGNSVISINWGQKQVRRQHFHLADWSAVPLEGGLVQEATGEMLKAGYQRRRRVGEGGGCLYSEHVQ